MNRRNFIKFGGSSLLAMNMLSGKTISQPDTKSTVWELEGITQDNFKKLFESLGGIKSFIKNEITLSSVLIKPNISMPHLSNNGTITHVNSIEALCTCLISFGIKKILIADHTLKGNEFQKIELNELPKKYPEVKLIFANEERFFEPIEVKGKVLKKTDMLKLISKVDLFINFANAKHHSATHVSLAIKNLMGAIWNRIDFHTNMDLHQGIADLATAIKPHLNLIDTTKILLNGGPTGPGPIASDNKLFASRDIVAIDSVVASRYNFGGKSLAPKEIRHLWEAYQHGLGEIDLNKIKIEKIV